MLYQIGRLLFILFYKICCKIRYIDRENIPDTGGYIVASNHVSYYDPFAVGTGLNNKIHYMAKEELWNNKIQGSIISIMLGFPIKRGTVDRTAMKTALKVLKDGEVLGIFPEGSRSETGEVHEGQQGAALISIMSGAPIVPAAVIGTKNALIRKFPPKWRRMTVKYGKPIKPEDFEGNKKERARQITEKVMESIRELKKELEEKWEL